MMNLSHNFMIMIIFGIVKAQVPVTDVITCEEDGAVLHCPGFNSSWWDDSPFKLIQWYKEGYEASGQNRSLRVAHYLYAAEVLSPAAASGELKDRATLNPDNATLHINSTARTDQHNYTCEHRAIPDLSKDDFAVSASITPNDLDPLESHLVTLTCEIYIQSQDFLYITWSRDNGDLLMVQTNNVWEAGTSYSERLTEEDSVLDWVNSTLLLNKVALDVSVEDESIYTCYVHTVSDSASAHKASLDFTNSSPNGSRSQSETLYKYQPLTLHQGQVHLLVDVCPDKLVVRGPSGVQSEDSLIELTCTVDPVRPEYTTSAFYWKFEDSSEHLVGHILTNASQPDGVVSQTNTLSYLVRYGDNGRTIGCVLELRNGDVNVTQDFILQVDYFPRGFAAASLLPEKSVTLYTQAHFYCNVSSVDVGHSALSQYLWEKRLNSNLTITMTPYWTWTVGSLDEAGDYGCRAGNNLGWTGQGSYVHLNVIQETPSSDVNVAAIVLGVLLGLLILVIIIVGLTIWRRGLPAPSTPSNLYETNEWTLANTRTPPSPKSIHCSERSVADEHHISDGRYCQYRKGHVVQLRDMVANSPVLLKAVISSALPYEVKQFFDEAEAARRLSNPDLLLELKAVCFRCQRPMVIYEFPEKGSLKRFLQDPSAGRAVKNKYETLQFDSHPEYENIVMARKEDKPQEQGIYENILPIGNKLNFALQIARGLTFLHQNEMLHPNLCCSSVWITYSDNDSFVCKLAGFVDKVNAEQSVKYDWQNENYVFARWWAPETANEGHLDNSSNIWSFAITVWEILNEGADPYSEAAPEREIIKKIKRGESPNGVTATNGLEKDLHRSVLSQCWAKEAAGRPSMEDISLKINEINKRNA